MKNLRVAIVTARFNNEITSQLQRSARETFIEQGIPSEHILEVDVPGAFELPAMAKHVATTTQVDAIVVLGAVVKGETAHFEYVAKGVTDGVMQLSLQVDTPIIFGVLTTYTYEQATERSGPMNLGREWAMGAIELIQKKQAIASTV